MGTRKRTKRGRGRCMKCPHHGPRCSKQSPLAGCGFWSSAYDYARSAISHTMGAAFSNTLDNTVHLGGELMNQFTSRPISTGAHVIGYFASSPFISSIGDAAYHAGYGARSTRRGA